MTDIVFLNDIYVNRSVVDNNVRIDKIEDKWSFWSRYLGPYTLKQACKDKNLDVIVIDYFTKINNFFECTEKIINKNTKLIGISTTFLHNTKNILVNDFNLWFDNHNDICNWFFKLKNQAPNAKIVLGGHLCDVFFSTFGNAESNRKLPVAMEKYIDYICQGYGEEIIIDIVTNNLNPSYIFERNNTKFIYDGKTAGNGAVVRPVVWDDNDGVQENEWLPLEISKGCLFGCKYCMFDKKGTKIKDKKQLKQELLRNYEMFGVTGYSLTDDTVNDSLSKVQMIHDVFTSLPFGIEFISYARPDMFYRFPEMFHMMIESGCKGVFLGIETFNPIAGQIAGKGLNPEKIKYILKWMKNICENNVFVLASFIIGLPGETVDSLNKTLDYLKSQTVIDKILWDVLYVRPKNNAYRTGNTDGDFSRDYDKYGFKEITYNPYYYWEHGTLNSDLCKEISKKWSDELSNHTYSGAEVALESFTNFWAYPRMRSLGYSHLQSFHMLRQGKIDINLYGKNKNWIANYHKKILS